MTYPYYVATTVTSDVWTEFDFGRPMYAMRIINDGSVTVQVSTGGSSDSIIDEIYTTETALTGREWCTKIYCKSLTSTAAIRVRAW